MSEGYAAPPPPPARRTRPATVTIAGLLMVLVAVAAVVYLAVSIAALGPLTDVFNEALAGTELEDSGGLFAATSLITGIGYLLVGITLLILTIFNNQGRNGSRITTWIIGGLGLCCGGLSLLSAAFTGLNTAGMGDDPNMPDPEELERLYAEHVPGWFDALTITSNVVGVLAVAVALILLALPPSNEFFRRTADQRQQPPPDYPQPGYPPVG